MKIGILTLPLHYNYGGILQAYALQTILERMGHKAVVLSIPPIYARKNLIHHSFKILKRCIKKYILRKNIMVDYNKYNMLLTQVACKQTNIFISKYIKRYETINYSSIKENDFDAYIVGSDQVWRSTYFICSGYPIECAFLSFTKDWKVKRIAYAPSFGTDKWEYTPDETKICKSLIEKFNAVSVREKGGVKLCKEHFNINALHVLDPTMLLQASDYIELIKKSTAPISKGTLHKYLFDDTPENKDFVNRIAKERKLTTFSVYLNIAYDQMPIERYIQPPIEQWLRAFYDAEFVVTDSFHACVFSILFRKQFIVIGNISRGLDRLHSILSLLGLENRLLTNVKDYKAIKPIDYNEVYQKLDNMRKVSMNFLTSALLQSSHTNEQ